MITELTAAQRALIGTYRDKWKEHALRDEPIDQESARRVIKKAHSLVHFEIDDLPFCVNPDLEPELNTLTLEIWNGLRIELYNQIKPQLANSVLHHLTYTLSQTLKDESSRFTAQVFGLWNGRLSPEYKTLGLRLYCWEIEGYFIDFCISVLNCDCNQQQWEIFQELTNYCGWIIEAEQEHRVCDRAYKLHVDEENRPHAEGKPALEFDHGFGLYAHHGVALPQRYGRIHPKLWQPEWLFEERNAELRRILIQEIGITRICEELQAEELDKWQEYTLLRVKNLRIRNEEILFLKMTCPSTSRIHILCVPPHHKTARAAIVWVNHGIAPEDFEIQT